MTVFVVAATTLLILTIVYHRISIYDGPVRCRLMLVSPATYICHTPTRLLAASHMSGIDYLEVDLIK